MLVFSTIISGSNAVPVRSKVEQHPSLVLKSKEKGVMKTSSVGKINIFLVAQQLYIRYNQTILNQTKPNTN